MKIKLIYYSKYYYFTMDLKKINYVRNNTNHVCRESIPNATCCPLLCGIEERRGDMPCSVVTQHHCKPNNGT